MSLCVVSVCGESVCGESVCGESVFVWLVSLCCGESV